MASQPGNQFILAADNSPHLLALLRANPLLASDQDEHGYSLIHAATSYNHLELLRTLVLEFKVNVDLRDEDDETALFVAETVECARVLVEELHSNSRITGKEGKTAREKIEAEGEFPEVAAYLLTLEASDQSQLREASSTTSVLSHSTPRIPDGISVELGTMTVEDVSDEVVDPDFKKRIEELAASGDFEGEEGQERLRGLITEVVKGQLGDERHVRPRTI